MMSVVLPRRCRPSADVLRLGLKRYPHHLFCLSSFEADAISVHRLVELLGVSMTGL